jgi:hypothetical protein
MGDEISVHDNVLVSYEVNCERRTICLHTQFRDRGPPFELTDVIFTGVVAYQFEHDSTIGTILFDVEDVDAIQVWRDNAASFRAGIPYGWPGEWANAEESAQLFFRENSIVGYVVAASCGLRGWILAKGQSRQTSASRSKAEQSDAPKSPVGREFES